MTDASPILFSFRVKFYPPNPLLLKEDVTRFQIYLQLKRDLLHGRLYCTANEAAMLGALIIQSMYFKIMLNNRGQFCLTLDFKSTCLGINSLKQ